MAKGASKSTERNWNARRSLVNTDESELALFRAERRVREIQAKLHRWADHDPQRDLWSARCPETGTAGAGGGSGKPTGGNTGRAPRADLTAWTGPTEPWPLENQGANRQTRALQGRDVPPKQIRLRGVTNRSPSGLGKTREAP